MGGKNSYLLPIFNAGKSEIEVEIAGNKQTTVVKWINVGDKFSLVHKEKPANPPSRFISPGKIYIFRLTKNQKYANITIKYRESAISKEQYLQRKKKHGIIVPLHGPLVYSKKMNFKQNTEENDALYDEAGKNHLDIFINKMNNIEEYKKALKKEKQLYEQKADAITWEWEKKIREAETEKASKLQNMITQTEYNRKMLKDQFEISDSDDINDTEEELGKSRRYIRESKKKKKDKVNRLDIKDEVVFLTNRYLTK